MAAPRIFLRTFLDSLNRYDSSDKVLSHVETLKNCEVVITYNGNELKFKVDYGLLCTKGVFIEIKEEMANELADGYKLENTIDEDEVILEIEIEMFKNKAAVEIEIENLYGIELDEPDYLKIEIIVDRDGDDLIEPLHIQKIDLTTVIVNPILGYEESVPWEVLQELYDDCEGKITHNGQVFTFVEGSQIYRGIVDDMFEKYEELIERFDLEESKFKIIAPNPNQLVVNKS